MSYGLQELFDKPGCLRNVKLPSHVYLQVKFAIGL